MGVGGGNGWGGGLMRWVVGGDKVIGFLLT